LPPIATIKRTCRQVGSVPAANKMYPVGEERVGAECPQHALLHSTK
jgi:hypothetical protein